MRAFKRKRKLSGSVRGDLLSAIRYFENHLPLMKYSEHVQDNFPKSRYAQSYAANRRRPRYAKLGGRVIYHPSDIDAWVEANKRSFTHEKIIP